MLSTYNGRAGFARVGMYSNYAVISQQTHEVCSEDDVFVHDYLASVQVLKNDLHRLYLDVKTMFPQEIFWDFNMLVEVRHNQIPMKWMAEEFDLNLDGVEFLTFKPRTEYSMHAIYKDPVTRAPIPITKDIFTAIVDGVKAQTSSVFYFAFLVVFGILYFAFLVVFFHFLGFSLSI